MATLFAQQYAGSMQHPRLNSAPVPLAPVGLLPRGPPLAPAHVRTSTARRGRVFCQAIPDSNYILRVQRQFDDLSATYDMDASGEAHHALAKHAVWWTCAEPGHRVLDIASGTGMVSLPLARKVGRQGSVTALDLSEGMLQQQRSKAQALGLTNIEFVQGDVATVTLPENHYDRIVICCAIPLFPDVPHVFRRCRQWIKNNADSRLVFQTFSTMPDTRDAQFQLLCEMATAAGLPLRDPNRHTATGKVCEDLCTATGFKAGSSCIVTGKILYPADSLEEYAESVWNEAEQSVFWPAEAAAAWSARELQILKSAYVAAVCHELDGQLTTDKDGRRGVMRDTWSEYIIARPV